MQLRCAEYIPHWKGIGMRHDHFSFGNHVTEQGRYSRPTLTMGKLTEAQIRLARTGSDGVRAVVDQLAAEGKV